MNKLLVKWLVWRIPVALFWIMILLSMVRVALPDYVPRNIYLAGLPAALIAIIGLVCVGPSHAKYLAWLMAFPLYLCYKLLVILHIHYGSFILALRSITSVFSGFLYFLVLFYTDVSLLNSTDNNLSRHLSLVAIATNYMVIVTSLRWALSPVSILARTSRLLRTIKEDELAKIDKQNTQTTHNAAVTDRKKSLSLELVRSFNDNFLVFVRENIRSLLPTSQDIRR